MWYLSLPQHLRQFLRPKRLAIFEACAIGLVSALAAVLLKQGSGWLGGWRITAGHTFPAWLVLPTIGLIGGGLTGWLIQRLAPEASGSGIPQVKAALAYVPIALNLRVALVKLVTTMLSLGSGLTLGRQGPTVQVGAALAAQCSRWVPTSPDYQRQLLAAGAAAGLAAGFNAPIAGVIFVVEELLQDVSNLTLGTAILASFVGGVVSRLLGGHGLNMILTTSNAKFSLAEIPLFLLLGVLAGLLGALFCKGIFVSLDLNRKLLRTGGLPLRIGLAGLLSGLVLAFLPASLRDNTGLQEFLVTGGAGWQITALAFVTKFLLTLVAYGSGAPGGLFAPSLILGSALGYLVSLGAEALQTALGVPPDLAIAIGSPTTYALTGMGAFFSAVTRGPITAIVIVFEMTTDFNLVLPLMMGSVVAYLVAEAIASGSIYKRLLAWNGIYLEQEAPIEGRLSGLTAADIMQRRVETLSSQMILEEVVQAFSRSHHRGFPVVDQGKLVGIVTQTDLGNIAQQQLSETMPLRALMTPQPVTVNPKDPLSHVLYLLNSYKISRLPVTEGRKLVGIITRADIIRAQSDQLSGKTEQLGPQPEASYVVYQTRSPALGRGRLLLPLSNPQTAASLIRLATAIARDRNLEIECLQVVLIPRSNSPAETAVSTAKSRRLLRQAENLGRAWQIPVHTQIRVAHDVSQAILETIKDRHIDLILMGWKGTTATPGRVFGGAVDTVIRQASCDVVLARLRGTETFNRWLVPIAGGPNAQYAVQLLPALTSLGETPLVKLCQVFEPNQQEPNTAILDQAARSLDRRLATPVIVTPVWGASVSEAVVKLAQKERCDVIALGASREGMLQQAIKGNIPEAIARNSQCTVILVRRAIA
ncbi:chloride channel protein [Trichocoleus desertorum AS-A10]|uniref:chloride channel protein n=1 Tax=Trichocoleus desertorum TaxID=1481672 RepID=UPI00329849C5